MFVSHGFPYASVWFLSRSSSSSSYSFRQKQGHVSPPTGMVRSWKFRHHIKARDTDDRNVVLHRLVARLLPLAKLKTELKYLLPFRRYLTGKTAQNADISLFFSLLLLFFFPTKARPRISSYRMVRSWKFRHHIKARDRTKTISDFGGKIPTR